ncbi:MAG TPA: hypothetical protein VF910_07700 [Candidatus Bathyarchaeia archaeon]
MLILMTAVGIVYMFGGAGTGIGIAFVFYFFANGIWNKLGAWPEGWYRIRQIPYRQLYVFTPNRRIDRYLKRESELKIGSAARAELSITKDKTGEYFIPTRGDEMFDNPNGAPASLYNWDDVRPIPVFGREPDALAADGKLVPKAKIDPMLVHQAYKNDFLERRHKLNVHQSNLKWGLFGFLIAFTVILAFASLFYTYYFGVNVNCALHTKACP